ncbi:hypothetical protein M0813_02818 [Anaeramoeba flamelloides]|uniref:MULE transposase domain-containing protein n=1 Tax=Anaeramoeba flamelloides TaxID=1746091 RepID=A0ABQ8YEG3_9EUKA|nr:hypothetical protein M0813_02818 [Anaeramoeba flamelloides]
MDELTIQMEKIVLQEKQKNKNPPVLHKIDNLFYQMGWYNTKKIGNVKSYRCVHRRYLNNPCPAKLHRLIQNNKIYNFTEFEHKCNKGFQITNHSEILIKSKIEELARNTLDSPEIITEKIKLYVSEKLLSGQSAKILPLIEVSQIVRNIRGKQIKIEKISDILDNKEYCLTSNGRKWIRQINLGDRKNIIFYTDLGLRYLLENNQVFIDSTYFCTVSPFKALFTIMTYSYVNNSYIPTIHFLIQNEDSNQFNYCLNYVKFKLMELKENFSWFPKIVTCDFSSAEIKSIRTIFGKNVIIQGCYFHYTQAIQKRIKKYKITNPEKIKKKLFSLIYLEHGIVREKIKQLIRKVKCKETKSFLKKYFIPTWFERFPPELWNIYGKKNLIFEGDLIAKTNNPIESMHRQLNTLIRKRDLRIT